MLRTALAVLCLSLAASAQTPFQVGPISSKEIGPGLLEVHVHITCNQQLPLAPKVPIPFSLLTMTGAIELHALQEDNLLGSLYQTDLDTNEDWTQMSVTDREGHLRIDELLVEPMAPAMGAPQYPYREDGEPRLYRLSPSGPTFQVLFFQDPVLGLNLQHRFHEPSILQCPNPCLELRVLESCGGLNSPADVPADPTFTVSLPDKTIEQHLTYCWEPWVFQELGHPARWLRGQWMALPLPSQVGGQDLVFQVQCPRTDTVMALTAQVSWATDPKVHQRCQPSVGLLRSPAGAR